MNTERNLATSSCENHEDATKAKKPIKKLKSYFKKQTEKVRRGIAVLCLVVYTVDVGSDLTGLYTTGNCFLDSE